MIKWWDGGRFVMLRFLVGLAGVILFGAVYIGAGHMGWLSTELGLRIWKTVLIAGTMLSAMLMSWSILSSLWKG